MKNQSLAQKIKSKRSQATRITNSEEKMEKMLDGFFKEIGKMPFEKK